MYIDHDMYTILSSVFVWKENLSDQKWPFRDTVVSMMCDSNIIQVLEVFCSLLST